MRYFDYSFLEHGMLPAGLVSVVGAISELRERENALKLTYPDVFTRLESVAKVQSVKGSNEIEGIVTSEQRINEIVNQNSAPLNHNEAEIAGYRDALALIHSDYAALDVRERDILRLHEIMLSYSPNGGGHYKDSDNVIMEVDAWVLEDLKKKKKFRRTATKIYKDLLRDEKLQELLVVGQQSVINYVSKRKKELIKNTYETAMFGLHSMCEAQVDFGDVPVIGANGNEEIWHELVISFPWSNAGFAQLCKFETKECLCEALQNIFEFIGGVPLRILFDNMSSAVVHIEENGKRTLTEMFMRFTMHHRFKAEFCNPDSPNEKGNVENKTFAKSCV